MELLDIQNIQNILIDLWNFHLVNAGIFITIFTVLYAFIVSKKNELKAISEIIKLGKNAPDVIQKKMFAINYIDELKAINNKCCKICVVSFILGLLCWITARILIHFECVQKIMTMILFFVTLILLIYSVCIFIVKIYKNYKKQTQIK